MREEAQRLGHALAPRALAITHLKRGEKMWKKVRGGEREREEERGEERERECVCVCLNGVCERALKERIHLLVTSRWVR